MAALVGSDAPTGRDILRVIGEGLDNDVWPGVASGGRLVPAQSTVANVAGSAKEVSADGAGPARRSEGSSTRSREGPAGRCTTERPSSPDQAAPIFRQLSDRMVRELDEVASAYPQARTEVASSGIWLTINVRPIPRLWMSATVLTLIPTFIPGRIASWARWDSDVQFGRWIGPRHSYFDGSICAFDQADEGWEDPSLLDRMGAISLWVARQAYAEAFGRWPGPQVIHEPAARLFFQSPSELCAGCGSRRPYSGCHLSDDLDDPANYPDRIVTALCFRAIPEEVIQRLRLQWDARSMFEAWAPSIRRRPIPAGILLVGSRPA